MRFRRRSAACLVAFMAGLTCGCADLWEGPRVGFVASARLNGEEFAAKPLVRERVIAVTNELFGAAPDTVKVPEGSGLPAGGRYLASHSLETDASGQQKLEPVLYTGPGAIEPIPAKGGKELYRRHCLHCHGLTGDGRGPTAAFLYPVPRDFRPGLFKFTSTPYGAKPTRDDLRRTIWNGLEGTSMPAFSAQLSEAEVQQVIDYVIFLSMRGETERMLAEEASGIEEPPADSGDAAARKQTVAEALPNDLGLELATGVFSQWQAAAEQAQTEEPPASRVPPTPESIAEGRKLFLGQTAEKLECAGCHGAGGDGSGPSYIDKETFDAFVFGTLPGPERLQALQNILSRSPEQRQRNLEAAFFGYAPREDRIAALKQIAEAGQKKWGDEWGDPLRPSNLRRGVFKGGRRPIDLYWRIATGITGTPMPAHASTLQSPEKVWHLVNYVYSLSASSESMADQASSESVTAGKNGGGG